MTKKKSVLIGVCTYKRPIMLDRCLSSIKELEIAHAFCVECVVVNNAIEPLSDQILQRYSCAKIQFTFLHCLERGIPFARNIILEYADNYRFDYCLFIDDDEVAYKDWVIELIHSRDRYDADVVQGQVVNNYAISPWLIRPLMRKKKFIMQDGAILKSISTCNVLISKELFARECMGLRFDGYYRLTGGSDAAYFERAANIKNLNMIFSSQALVEEDIPVERCNLRHYFMRFARNENNKVFSKTRQVGIKSALPVHFSRFCFSFLKFIVFSCLALIFLFLPNVFRRMILNALVNLGRIYGIFVACRGKRVPIYKTTTGF